jgi:hypothetical protein
MPAPRIAIIGSYDPQRQERLDLRQLDDTVKAGEDLGRELARQGFHIIVYSSEPHSLEVDVVRGYLEKPEQAAGSIQVLFSQQYARERGEPTFPQKKADDERFDYLPDLSPDWESSFYRSLATVDGVLIVGGGPSALVAGIVAISHQKPVVACATFGGSGEKVWRALREQTYPLDRVEFSQMAAGSWSSELAPRLIKLLTRQRDGFAQRLEETHARETARVEAVRRKEYQENARINWHAVVSALLFIAAASTWPFAAYRNASSLTEALVLVLLTTMIAGASGSTIRVVLDWAGGVDRTFVLSAYNQYILLRFAALGTVAGGLAGVSFVLAQLFATPQPADTAEQALMLAQALKRLIPFLMIIGFAAGLGAEIVLSNLRKAGTPPVEVPRSNAKSS